MTRRAGLPSPLAAGVLLGIGLGALVDGIVLHQLLQWHQLLSGWLPRDTLERIRVHIVADGLFHSAAWIVTVVGVHRLWLASRAGPLPGRRVLGGALIGWGGFDLVEGLVDHALLGLHRVNERVPPDERLLWDLGFLALGAVLVAAGWKLARPRRHAATV